jgi:hypothetical protein
VILLAATALVAAALATAGWVADTGRDSWLDRIPGLRIPEEDR